MRKLLPLFLMLLISFSMQAQNAQSLQRRVLGLELAKSYSYEQLKEHFRESYSTNLYEISKSANMVMYGITNVSFAGDTWNAIIAMLNEDKEKLMFVILVKEATSKSMAEKQCDEYVERLAKKYGEPTKEELSEGIISNFGWKDNATQITASVTEADSSFGFCISYIDSKSKDRYQELIEDEL